MSRRSVRALAAILALCAAGAVTPALASAAVEPEPFKEVLGGKGLMCVTGAKQSVQGVGEIEYEGKVRFCQGNGSTERIPSWDGVHLDVDVTLPPAADTGPYPTIVMLHGYGSSKTNFEFPIAAGDGNEIFDYNNDYFAQHGYAVVNYTARGFAGSCGTLYIHEPSCASHGFIHLADQRYEARDTQYLLGLLVEEGIAQAGKLGVTGISYGGGQSITLAYLKNRIRCAGPPDEEWDGPAGSANPCEGKPENALVPWTTPDGAQKLEIDAAYARWPWSDIANSLIPNGRFLEYEPSTYGQDGSIGSGSPVGVPLTSYTHALYAEGYAPPVFGYYEPAGGSFEWNLSSALVRFEHPEPENPEDEALVTAFSKYHGGYALGGEPAPLLMESGWNDDLFPPEETLRVYNSVREAHPSAYVALQFGDVGHSRGTNRSRADQYFDAQGASFFAEQLRGEKEGIPTGETGLVSAPEAGSASAYTTTCPTSAKDGGVEGGPMPYVGRSWQALQKGVVSFSGGAGAVTNPASEEDRLIGGEFDPILMQLKETPGKLPSTGEGACKSVAAIEPKGTASYFDPVTEEFTLMGLPTISADVTVSGTKAENGELDARLWDVKPGATPSETTETLVSRGDFRLEEPQTPKIVFQLHGNGYTFAKGDVVKLELTSSEYPYYYATEEPYSVAVKSVHVSLPTADEPSSGGQVGEPGTLPKPEPPLPKPKEEKKAEEGPSAKSEPTPEIIHVKEPAPKCTANWPVTIRLPRYKHGKVKKIVITLNGKRVKKVVGRHGRALHSVSYVISGEVSKTTELKLHLLVTSRRHHKSKATKKTLTRTYHLCESS